MPDSLFVCYDFKVEPLYPGCEILIAQLSELGFDSFQENNDCLLYTSPSPRDRTRSRMPSSA